MATDGLEESVLLLDPTLCRGMKQFRRVEDTSESGNPLNIVTTQQNTIININADKT